MWPEMIVDQEYPPGKQSQESGGKDERGPPIKQTYYPLLYQNTEYLKLL